MGDATFSWTPIIAAKRPCLFLLIEVSEISGFHQQDAFVSSLESYVADEIPTELEFRRTQYERLELVLNTGCDVSPSDSPFHSGPLSKAMEYGHTGCEYPRPWSNKILIGFDQKLLSKSWLEVDSSMPSEELKTLMDTYPTDWPSVDGENILLSRFPRETAAPNPAYEMEYGKWIPGETWEAVRLVALISNDKKELHSQFINAVSQIESGNTRWQFESSRKGLLN
jgi:hypothetical protein